MLLALSFRPKHPWTTLETISPLRTMPSVRSSIADRHQKKRQFQPQITDFFSFSLGSADRNLQFSDSKWPSSQSKGLDEEDASVQASLLNVGMRIRKAVPEGYKTHKSHLFTDSTPVVASAMPVLPEMTKPAELRPFCGIHKVGGLGIQESFADYLSGYGSSRSGPVDAFTTFNSEDGFSSQESNASVIHQDSAMANGGPVGAIQEMRAGTKRRLDYGEDGFESEEEDLFSIPTFLSMASIEGRYIAKPRSRRKAAQITVPTISITDTDFEDASFLVPCGHEVEMGGT
jgi:Ribonucleotide reductase inhibitor